MKQYLDCLKHVYTTGEDRNDRTGVGTRGVFGYQMRFNLGLGFPAPTTKRLAWNAMSSELLWFLEGSSNERRLAEILYPNATPSELEQKTTIWTANAINQGKALGYKNGELGPVYGKQWRKWKYVTSEADINYDEDGDMIFSSPIIREHEIDQIAQLIEGIKNDPFGRRHIISAWNVAEIDQMALPPCHCLVQFYVSMSGKLSCQLYQRSADVFLGVPFNIASYALLTHMIAQVCGLEVGDFVWTGGDVHIYQNHIEQVEEQLTRVPEALSKLWVDPMIKNIDDFTMESFKLVDYNPMATIKAPMAV